MFRCLLEQVIFRCNYKFADDDDHHGWGVVCFFRLFVNGPILSHPVGNLMRFFLLGMILFCRLGCGVCRSDREWISPVSCHVGIGAVKWNGWMDGCKRVYSVELCRQKSKKKNAHTCVCMSFFSLHLSVKRKDTFDMGWDGSVAWCIQSEAEVRDRLHRERKEGERAKFKTKKCGLRSNCNIDAT